MLISSPELDAVDVGGTVGATGQEFDLNVIAQGVAYAGERDWLPLLNRVADCFVNDSGDLVCRAVHVKEYVSGT